MMSKSLFIPTIGTEIILAEPWTFKLYRESRNWKLFQAVNIHWADEEQLREVTISAGAILKVNRIYIRLGYSEYDSVTFGVRGGRVTTGVFINDDSGNTILLKGKKSLRFWAKLDDVNHIVMED